VMFVVIFGFLGTEKLSACLLHVQNVKALIGISQKEQNNYSIINSDWELIM
jgi:hypothetical protein